ncbi:hypothetical protein FKM82_030155 [Ascaphus truei]
MHVKKEWNLNSQEYSVTRRDHMVQGTYLIFNFFQWAKLRMLGNVDMVTVLLLEFRKKKNYNFQHVLCLKASKWQAQQPIFGRRRRTVHLNTQKI